MVLPPACAVMVVAATSCVDAPASTSRSFNGSRPRKSSRAVSDQVTRHATTTRGGMNEMDPPLCGTAVISHNEVSETDHQRTTRRTSPMQQEISTVAIDLAKKSFISWGLTQQDRLCGANV
jgi:hypothetical protein